MKRREFTVAIRLSVSKSRQCLVFSGRPGKTAALLFPFVFVVLFVRHHFQNEDFLAGIQHPRNQAILVSANIEDDAISNEVRIPKRCPDISPMTPCDGLVTDMRVPGS